MTEPLAPAGWTMPPIAAAGPACPYTSPPAAEPAEPVERELTTQERLELLRDRLTDAVREASVRDLAPLAGRLQRVLEQLDALTPTERASPLDELLGSDELAPRRAARG